MILEIGKFEEKRLAEGLRIFTRAFFINCFSQYPLFALEFNLKLLEGAEWRQLSELVNFYKIAPKTIYRILKDLMKRGWIIQRGKKYILNNEDLIEEAKKGYNAFIRFSEILAKTELLVRKNREEGLKKLTEIINILKKELEEILFVGYVRPEGNCFLSDPFLFFIVKIVMFNAAVKGICPSLTQLFLKEEKIPMKINILNQIFWKKHQRGF